ncbi:MAG TPA: hypothetical protein VMV26_12815 [Alphaproteobacteria bacterium]|jgi:hypothetical protein|nr:hypothetical protein [Alphaproteobacteria bacterium]
MYINPLRPRRGDKSGSDRDALPSQAPHAIANAMLLLLVTMLTAYSLGMAVDDSGFLPVGRPAISSR